MPGSPIAVGVSACLLGERVRYDGGHKRDRYITEILGNYFSFVPVCPEVESGMPVPREAMRLEGEPEAPRLVTHATGRDLTEQMLAYCRQKTVELESADLCGFVFKKDSPSSGLWRVKVHNHGMPTKSGSGLFAAAVVRQFPLLPVEEEGRLHDLTLRENFIERVFAYRRWKDYRRNDGSMGGLVAFHTRHKFQLMAHNPMLYRELGKLVAIGKEKPKATLLEDYEADFMHCLGYHATPRKNADVLMHLLGFFKNDLTAGEKEELLEVINDYRLNLIPLVVPLVLIRHYIRRFGQPYLQEQTYLAPHPGELMLRNHV
jgi:uncharacterized protein YbgA (DUF1722 family)/uncharacterized protein YbbK (DUF523 family)